MKGALDKWIRITLAELRKKSPPHLPLFARKYRPRGANFVKFRNFVTLELPLFTPGPILQDVLDPPMDLLKASMVSKF